MATIYASRAQMIIGGAPVSAFLVNQQDLLSIYVKYNAVNTPVYALNYTPTAISVIQAAKQINLVFDYAYSNGAALFDFSTLPYDITNIQFLLFSETNDPLCLISNTFFHTDSLSYPDAGTHAKRSVTLGGLDITYFGI